MAVLGNSDFALHEAEALAPVAGSVTIYTDGEEPEFSREPAFTVNTMKIQSVEGEEKVSGLRLAHEPEKEEHVDGVFVALGTAGSAEMARQMGAALTEKGNILVNERMESTIPGIFAAGDCTGGLLQVAKAVYDGAQAGISASQYVRSRKDHR